MVTNNEAIENFLSGKRNLAAYQFSQIIKETTLQQQAVPAAPNVSDIPTNTILPNLSSPGIASASPPHASSSSASSSISGASNSIALNSFTDADLSQCNLARPSQVAQSTQQPQPNCDEIAFNYAMVNLFTGCPQRASVIFSDLTKRYRRNPRLWLRLAESMLAAERAKLSEFEHIQQLAYPHSRDHLIKSKNKPILIKINPQYCQQQIQQQFQVRHGAPSNFLVTIKGHLLKSLELINEYNDISLLTDDVPSQSAVISEQSEGSPSASISASSFPMTPTGMTHPPTNSSNLTNADEISSQLSKQLSYSNPYRSISRSELYHLRNKVQLNLAYVCLCMGEPVKALEFTTQCLKSSPLGYEKVLANLYHAEACILASRVDEAIRFLNMEILTMAKSLSQEYPAVASENKRIVCGDDLYRQLETGALATVVTFNLSVAYAAKGEFSNAYKVLMRSVQPTRPNPMQVIICLLYIQLQQGQLESAKRTILNNLPQFR